MRNNCATSPSPSEGSSSSSSSSASSSFSMVQHADVPASMDSRSSSSSNDEQYAVAPPFLLPQDTMIPSSSPGSQEQQPPPPQQQQASSSSSSSSASVDSHENDTVGDIMALSTTTDITATTGTNRTSTPPATVSTPTTTVLKKEDEQEDDNNVHASATISTATSNPSLRCLAAVPRNLPWLVFIAGGHQITVSTTLLQQQPMNIQQDHDSNDRKTDFSFDHEVLAQATLAITHPMDDDDENNSNNTAAEVDVITHLAVSDSAQLVVVVTNHGMLHCLEYKTTRSSPGTVAATGPDDSATLQMTTLQSLWSIPNVAWTLLPLETGGDGMNKNVDTMDGIRPEIQSLQFRPAHDRNRRHDNDDNDLQLVVEMPNHVSVILSHLNSTTPPNAKTTTVVLPPPNSTSSKNCDDDPDNFKMTTTGAAAAASSTSIPCTTTTTSTTTTTTKHHRDQHHQRPIQDDDDNDHDHRQFYSNDDSSDSDDDDDDDALLYQRIDDCIRDLKNNTALAGNGNGNHIYNNTDNSTNNSLEAADKEGDEDDGGSGSSSVDNGPLNDESSSRHLIANQTNSNRLETSVSTKKDSTIVGTTTTSNNIDLNVSQAAVAMQKEHQQTTTNSNINNDDDFKLRRNLLHILFASLADACQAAENNSGFNPRQPAAEHQQQQSDLQSHYHYKQDAVLIREILRDAHDLLLARQGGDGSRSCTSISSKTNNGPHRNNHVNEQSPPQQAALGMSPRDALLAHLRGSDHAAATSAAAAASAPTLPKQLDGAMNVMEEHSRLLSARPALADNFLSSSSPAALLSHLLGGDSTAATTAAASTAAGSSTLTQEEFYHQSINDEQHRPLKHVSGTTTTTTTSVPYADDDCKIPTVPCPVDAGFHHAFTDHENRAIGTAVARSARTSFSRQWLNIKPALFSDSKCTSVKSFHLGRNQQQQQRPNKGSINDNNKIESQRGYYRADAEWCHGSSSCSSAGTSHDGHQHSDNTWETPGDNGVDGGMLRASTLDQTKWKELQGLFVPPVPMVVKELSLALAGQDVQQRQSTSASSPLATSATSKTATVEQVVSTSTREKVNEEKGTKPSLFGSTNTSTNPAVGLFGNGKAPLFGESKASNSSWTASTNLFGNPAQAPLFGTTHETNRSSSPFQFGSSCSREPGLPFGATSPSASTNSTARLFFGKAQTPMFGEESKASTSNWTASTNLFTSQATNPFSGLFAPSSSSSSFPPFLFGSSYTQTSASPFGAATKTNLSTNSAAGLFGSAQHASPLFGEPTTNAAATNTYGANNNIFGRKSGHAQTSKRLGTGSFRPTSKWDADIGRITLQSITALEAYDKYSFEELRFQDYSKSFTPSQKLLSFSFPKTTTTTSASVDESSTTNPTAASCCGTYRVTSARRRRLRSLRSRRQTV